MMQGRRNWMNKEDAVKVMIEKVFEIERERLAMQNDIESNKYKKESTERILSALKEVDIDHED